MIRRSTYIDYYLSIDMAKQLCMVENNEKGMQARKYFIECENRLKSLKPKFPQTEIEWIEYSLKLAKEKEQLQIENEQKSTRIEQDQPKVDFFNAVTDSKTAIEMSKVAKILNMGFGRNQLFQLLRDQKILRSNNEPYQKYVDYGYFRIIEQKYIKANGDTNINIKTLVYQKGLDFIRKKLNE